MSLKRTENGLFIVFEGGEGSGKTTMAKHAVNYLIEKGYDAIYTREPGGIEAAEKIRDVVVNNFTALGAVPQLFLYSASRYINTRDIIIPAMDEGKIVICDRYALSSIAYQGEAGGIPIKDVMYVQKMATMNLKPDLEIVLDIDPFTGLKRAKAHADGEVNEIDELDLEFHKFGEHKMVIDASKPVDIVKVRVEKAIARLLETKFIKI